MIIPPSFNLDLVPDADREVVGDLAISLDRLGALVVEMQFTLELFEHCRQLTPPPPAEYDGIAGLERRGNASRKYEPWKIIALRNGALTISDFYQVLEVCRKGVTSSEWLSQQVNVSAMEEANAIYNEHFPDFPALRHAAAHSGRDGLKTKDINDNAIKGDFQIEGLRFDTRSVYIRSSAFNSRYVWTLKGRALSYVLNAETIAVMATVRDKTWDAFESIDLSGRQKARRYGATPA